MRFIVLFACCALAASRALAAADTPLAALPYTPGLDVRAMDRGADPCSDFYRYACGGWKRDHPIPPDQASWDVYRKLAHDNRRFLWGILRNLARGSAGGALLDGTQRKLGDYFAACMDEDAVERRGAAALAPWLAAIDAMRSPRELAPVLAKLQLATGDGGLFFALYPGQDYGDARRVIAFADAGGLGLPDRDYYVRDDEAMRNMRLRYAHHVARMFALLGDPPEVARREAGTVLAIETALARATLAPVEQRDPHRLFHRMDRRALAALAPAFDWDAYLRALGRPRLATFNVTQPGFFRALSGQLATRDLDEIQTYLRWHAASAAAPYLSDAFVRENFDFYGRTLHGIPRLAPRWRRCVSLVDGQLGEALGKEFVRRAFTSRRKARVRKMAREIEDAMAREIAALGWMGPETKRFALAKLRAVVNKIGYPDRWRDYGPLVVRRHDFFGNVERAGRFESRRQLRKIGRPVDREEWEMTPPTVNAYYDPQLNTVNFPAGVLQPPLYDPRMDAAPNYGNTGGTIGHELTHGFDDEGRKFDAHGDLRDWWTARDARAFESRAQCVVDQYAGYVVVDDIHVNSRLTEGEDIADLGGLVLAWSAWQASGGDRGAGPRDGLTPQQRFFVGYAQWACENDRPENQRVKATTDPHSPAPYRVNGVVANMPEFARAFSCKAGAPLAPAKRCRVW